MTRVIIEGEGRTVEIDAAEGVALADLCDEHRAPVPFSCRTASCGTCRAEVLEGMDALMPPADEELDVLDIFGDDPSRRRLVCQAKVGAGGSPLVRIRALQDA